MDAIRGTLLVLNAAALAYFVLYLVAYLFQALVAWRDVWLHSLRVRTTRLQNLGLERSPVLPPISLLVPAFNEGPLVVDSVKSLLQSSYPQFEVILVNDGSRDDTLDRLIAAFSLRKSTRAPYVHVRSQPIRGIYTSPQFPRLIVVDKENGGKADALNAGLNAARHHLIACLDADSVLEPDSLLRAARPFLENPWTVASSGVVRVANGCTVVEGEVREVGLSQKPLVVMQVLEYARAFFLSRAAFSEVNALPLISGAFGLFRRDVVAQLGGFATNTVAEDMELVMRLHEYFRRKQLPFNVAFVADPVAWTEAPETLAVLGRQRSRWHRGLAQVLWRYRYMLFRPRYGFLGMVVLPFYWLFELLEPLVEVLGYLTLLGSVSAGLTGIGSLVGLFGLVTGANLIIGLLALLFEETSFGRYNRPGDILRAVLYTFTDAFWYRWLTVGWRLQGLWQAVRGHQQWGSMQRTAAWSGTAGTGARAR